MVKSLFLLPAVFLVGFAAAPSAVAFQDNAKPGEAPAHAREIYKIDCAICHGDNGDGKTDLAASMKMTLTDFTDPKTFEGKSDKDIFEMIRKGKDPMPPEDAGRAKDADVHGLILYIRGMSKGHTPPAAAPEPAATPTPAPASNPAPGGR